MQKQHYARFSVTLPPEVADKIRVESERSGIKISTLVAKAVVAWLGGSGLNKNTAEVSVTKRAATRPFEIVKGQRITNEQFDTLVSTYRGTAPLVHAARLVLVEGYSQVKAAKESGVTHRQDVCRAINKIVQLKNSK